MVFARHSTTWSAWTRWLSTPLVLVPLWTRRWSHGAWARPVAEPGEALTAFRGLYADPVTINARVMPVEHLVAMAAGTHAALERIGVRTIDVLTVTDGRITGVVVNVDEVGLLAQLGAGVHEAEADPGSARRDG